MYAAVNLSNCVLALKVCPSADLALGQFWVLKMARKMVVEDLVVCT